MKRNSIIISEAILNFTAAVYPEIKDSEIEIRIDEENATEILKYVISNKKKFARILREVLLGSYYNDLYGYEPPKGKNVTAMKFKGKQNIRIVCKEIFCDNKKVIMVALFHKKSTKGKNISKRDLNIYKAVGDYEYDC